MSVKLGQIAATRVDLVPPDIAAELALLQNQVRAEPTERMRPVIETELGGPVEEAFAAFDWEPLAAASIGQTYRARLRTRRGGRGQGAAPGHRGDHGAGPGRARAGGQPGAAAHGVRAERAVRGGADPVRPQPAGRARLPPGGRRHVGDARAARTGLRGPRAAGLRRAVHPSADGHRGAGGLHGRGQRAAGRVRHRPPAPGRAPAALDARPGPAHRGVPRRPAPGEHLRPERRLARADRLRRRRPPRPHPATGGDRHHGRAGPARRQPPPGGDRAGGRDGRDGGARAPGTGLRPTDGRAHAGRPARSTRRSCRTWWRRCRSSASGSPATS